MGGFVIHNKKNQLLYICIYIAPKNFVKTEGKKASEGHKISQWASKWTHL